DWVSLTSRHVGTLVHRELERMCRSRVADVQMVSDASRERFRLELEELGVPADRSAEAAERVLAALRSTLEDARGRWLLGFTGEIEQAEAELALSSAAGGQIVGGIIDRTFLDRTGTRWIVDFKTSVHEGG